MALTRVTKHIVYGSLLVQFKYIENSGDHSVDSNQSTYQTINNKTITMTPQYSDSILENMCSFTMRQQSGTGNHDRLGIKLNVNGSNEYEQTELFGQNPHGNNHSQSGGRNDRLAPTRRHGHVSDIAQPVNFSHSFRPGTTNSQLMEVLVRNTDAARTFLIRDFFFIAKELSLGLDSSGQA